MNNRVVDLCLKNHTVSECYPPWASCCPIAAVALMIIQLLLEIGVFSELLVVGCVSVVRGEVRQHHVLLMDVTRYHLHGDVLQNAGRSQAVRVGVGTAIRSQAALLGYMSVICCRRWVGRHGHPSTQCAHAVVALHLWLAEIIYGHTSDWVTGSAGDVRWSLMGHQAPGGVAAVLPGRQAFVGLGRFLGVSVKGCVCLQTHSVHIGERRRRCTSSGSSILCLEAVVLSWGQAEGAGKASAPSCSSPTLAGLTGAPRHVGRDGVVGVGGAKVAGAVGTELRGLA